MAQAVALDPGGEIAAALAPLGAGVAIDPSVGDVAGISLDELEAFARRVRDEGLVPERVWGWMSHEDADWRQLVFAFPAAGDADALREQFASLMDATAADGATPEFLDQISFDARCSTHLGGYR